MRRRRPPTLAAVGALAGAVVLLAVAAADGGWIVVDHSGDQTLISQGRLKMAPRRTEDASMVLDLVRGRMWVADAGRRLYWEGTVEEYCEAAGGMMALAQQQLSDHVKNMPPAQRAQMEQMMRPTTRGAGTAPRVTIERAGDTETIAGLPANKYRVLANERLHEELWLTSDPALTRELELGRAPDTFGRLFACLAGPASGGERVEASPEYRQIFARGWPLKAVHHGEGVAAARTLVTRVERREIPERDFTPPAAFRPAPLVEIFGQRR
jgi:hypothetical protein